MRKLLASERQANHSMKAYMTKAVKTSEMFKIRRDKSIDDADKANNNLIRWKRYALTLAGWKRKFDTLTIDHQDTKDSLIRLRANNLGDWDPVLRAENRHLSFKNSTLKTELAELQKQVDQFHMKYSHCRERNDDLKREQATLTNLIDSCDKMFDELNKKGWDAYKECYNFQRNLRITPRWT